MRVSTIGFTRKSARRFFQLLRDADAQRIVDVRLNNSSQLAGFAKKDDLAWFARELCGMDYIHVPDLAPTKELLRDYRQGRIGWETYEARFMDLMEARRIECVLSREVVNDGCLLCSEDQPHHCHRRLIAEYLKKHWGELEIEHLGLEEDRRATPEILKQHDHRHLMKRRADRIAATWIVKPFKGAYLSVCPPAASDTAPAVAVRSAPSG